MERRDMERERERERERHLSSLHKNTRFLDGILLKVIVIISKFY
jgi:hypothetical protein